MFWAKHRPHLQTEMNRKKVFHYFWKSAYNSIYLSQRQRKITVQVSIETGHPVVKALLLSLITGALVLGINS